ncbi:MAG: phosphoribosylformylglycinamidine synthase subunit PurS [SAR202 cluster bacterium]|nr:MAG: phosphoribosylformylglycinamidine synthase subunit PurS [SAR202 cluster bacterium]MAR86636.1 phosphoribosylformylglycinamidine synthase [Chloroflexota bacterium]KAA1305545.1 MAG: phosphoribosylformylglycinamidine synthase subunit PurS [SAR202 cluster bacterium]MEC7733425.1 phosphoribosylformylglycinamidine synthase subunit PurS [Chloroflexota bacterium]MEC8986342.1 phosphoribosylformylglycinamidine synthase subunit PurS [Chloroflexota bacterium]
MFIANIYVSLKSTVSDPQGATVSGALSQLGFDSVKNVRVGKYITLEIEKPTKEEAESAVSNMCEQLLANTVIEEYRFEFQ